MALFIQSTLPIHFIVNGIYTCIDNICLYVLVNFEPVKFIFVVSDYLEITDVDLYNVVYSPLHAPHQDLWIISITGLFLKMEYTH